MPQWLKAIWTALRLLIQGHSDEVDEEETWSQERGS
jgi:hypothetical protein